MKATPPRLSREEKKSLTRRQLIDAAARVFARDGYEGASVDDVAAEAGYTKGAIYSNFGTKLELVLELLEDRCRAWCNRVAGAYLVEGDVGDWLESGARELTQLTEKEGDWYLLFIEIWTQAVRKPELRTRLAAIYEEARQRAAEVVESRSRKLGFETSVPPEVLATVFIAATDGFVLQKLVNPGRFPSGYLAQGLHTLLAGVPVSTTRTHRTHGPSSSSGIRRRTRGNRQPARQRPS